MQTMMKDLDTLDDEERPYVVVHGSQPVRDFMGPPGEGRMRPSVTVDPTLENYKKQWASGALSAVSVFNM